MRWREEEMLGAMGNLWGMGPPAIPLSGVSRVGAGQSMAHNTLLGFWSQ